MVKVQITKTIQAPAESIWKTIRAYDNVESYIPMVIGSTISGTDEGCERVCKVQFGEQQAELVEKLDLVDEENKTMKFTIVKDPSPFGGQQVTYQVKSSGENISEVLISTKVEEDNEEATKGMQDVFQMSSNGLKKLHEKEVKQ